MGMFSEIATESTVKAVVAEIEREMLQESNAPESIAVLKKVGRFALTQFEWGAPDWAGKYRELFRE